MRAATLAAVASFLVFLPSFFHPFVDFDDAFFLLRTDGWRGLGPSAWKWAATARVGSIYQPLSWLTYSLDHALWGLDARGFHLQSALWHALTAGLLVLLARRALAAARPPGGREPVWALDAAALFSGLFFGLHPLRVESVAWASERRDVVCGAFAVAAALAYVRAREPGKEPRPLWPVAALHGLALAAKGMAMTLPLALLILDWYPLRRSDARACVREKAPLFALSAIFAAAGVAVQQRMRWPLSQHGVIARAVQAAYALAFYALKTVWPWGLRALYELRPPMRLLEPKFVLATGAVALALIWLRENLRSRPWAAASAAAYAVMLAPVSGLFRFGPQLVADRYSYLPMLPGALLAGAALRAGLARSRGRALGAAALVAAGLAAVCVRQQSYWASTEALWARVLEADPDCATAQLSLGALRAGQGRLHEAASRFQVAADATPGCFEEQDRLAALLKTGAEGPETEALRAKVETNPICRKARSNLAAVAAQTGGLEEAIRSFTVIAAVDPSDEAARRNLERARAELRIAGLRPKRLSRGTRP